MTTRLQAVLTVTIDAEGDYYADHADLIANVTGWIEGGLDDRDDIRTVTIVEQPAPVGRAAVIAEALARVEDPEQRALTSAGLGLGWEAARDVLRRMAAETQQPEWCANCGLEVENRGLPGMDGNHRDRWVHIPGGYTICHPQKRDGLRATPAAKEAS